jgi:hypothetical protein
VARSDPTLNHIFCSSIDSLFCRNGFETMNYSVSQPFQ